MNNASEMNNHDGSSRANVLKIVKNEGSKVMEFDRDEGAKVDPEIIPMSQVSGLPVAKFDFNLLPSSLQPWAKDMQHRLQCPADYIGVGVMIGLAASVGNKVTIYPKAKDSWEVVPNLWGLLIGEPSSMKSPALDATLKPIHSIEEILRDNDKRLVVKDTTIEKLQEIQCESPEGLLYVQDEISALFKKFDQPSSNDRQYLLEAFNGNSSYSVDRITRGSFYIPKNTLSLIGGIQPSVLQSIFQSKDSTDDGFIQRLQLAVWPDRHEYKYVDSPPYEEAQRNAWFIYTGLYQVDEKKLRFDSEAQRHYVEWFNQSITLAENLEASEKSNLSSHIVKYRKMVPALALLLELANNQKAEKVGEEALLKAIEWSKYLASHARRIYGYKDESALAAEKLYEKRHKLKEGFSPSEVTQKGWSGLKDLGLVKSAITVLVSHNYLIHKYKGFKATGGKPSSRYRWNHRLD
jgi:hypothetical protein